MTNRLKKAQALLTEFKQQLAEKLRIYDGFHLSGDHQDKQKDDFLAKEIAYSWIYATTDHHLIEAVEPPIKEVPKTFLRKAITFYEAVTFQTLPEQEGCRNEGLTRTLHGSLPDHLPLLAKLNSEGAGIFYTVNATDLKGRRLENIIGIRSVFVDLDGASLEPILNAPLEPHAIVESSPGRYHAYWIVEGVILAEFSNIQKLLAEKFNGDKAVHDLPRLMRLPGFFHLKKALFLLTVAESGDRKTATDNAALGPIYDYQKMLQGVYREDIMRYQNECERWEARKKEALKNLKDKQVFDERPPVPPLRPLMLIEEPTYQGLVKYFPMVSQVLEFLVTKAENLSVDIA